ncbi:hypothetical protein GCM10008107_00290 [Psychrosphaera saromensis]|uniref:Uncharacterized protein n=2 Tax=Psychrosphaera saromensis TaxID=716813 RepID=A0A2S7UZQ9_9GAMM|nr:hypothetical protein BTO11_15905 [Psychrosphaera saromensis]GHB55529.1 hypothetical protein GCM10008107_00290 [Psychrosphaera saromensis]GLQ13751.1 hypothetical protein GCM10007917_12060 [Psychrosphaera saromensis]
MLPKLSQVLVLTVLFTAFIGQAVGYNMFNSCEESRGVSSSNLGSSNLIVSNVTASVHNDFKTSLDNTLSSTKVESSEHVKSQVDCCTDECCDGACVCIANGCTSAMSLNVELIPATSMLLSESPYLQSFAQPKSIATSRYRPPIFTS